jgi:hypothetical protein
VSERSQLFPILLLPQCCQVSVNVKIVETIIGTVFAQVTRIGEMSKWGPFDAIIGNILNSLM